MKFAFCLVGLIAVAAVSANPPRGLPEGEIPFFCATEVWSDSFDLVSSRHEKATNQLIFTLKAKKAARVASFVAYIGDGDNVALTTLSVKFTPDLAQVKAGTQLKAVVSLNQISVKDIGNLAIRQRR